MFKERIRAIRRVQDGMAFPLDYSNSQLSHQGGSMLSVIVQSESGENSSGTSSIHLPLENRDFTYVSPPSRGHLEGPSRHFPERRPSLHRTHTSQSNPPSSPGGVAATNPPGRSPKITLPQLGTSYSNLTHFRLLSALTQLCDSPQIVRSLRLQVPGEQL